MSDDYGINDDGGFRLSHMVQAQRGLSDREIEIFLATGRKPDLSQLPPEELENIDDNTQVMPVEDAAVWLSGGVLTASSFFDFDSSHGVSPLYEVVRPKVESFRFDKNQPRDEDGKWTDGFPGVNPPDLTSKPSGIKTGGSAKSTKKVTPAVIYKKHDDGAVVGHSASGQRMRWDGGRKKFIVEQEKSGSWVEESAHTKTSAYNEFKNPDKWFEPTETGTENEPSSPSLTPEPDPADTDTTAETPEVPPGWKAMPGGGYYKSYPTQSIYHGSEIQQAKDGTWTHDFFDGKKYTTTKHDTLEEALAHDPLAETKAPDSPAKPDLKPEPEKIAPSVTSQDLNAYPPPESVPMVDPDWPFSYEPFQEPQMDYGHLVRSNDDAYANDPNHDYELKTLPVNKIVPSQENDYEEWGDGLENDMTGKPFAIKKDGNFYLMDGHHRTAKAGENGSIQAWVLDLDKPKTETPKAPVADPAQLDSLTPQVPETADEVWDSLNDNIGSVVAKSKNGVGRLVARQGANGPYLETQWQSGDGKRWDIVKGQEVTSVDKLHGKFTSGYPIFEPVAPHADEWSTKVAAPKTEAPKVEKPKSTPTVWPDGWESGNTLTPAQAQLMNDKLVNWSDDQQSALYGYTQHADMLNNALRRDLSHTSDGEDVAEWSGLIDDGMYELPEDLTVFRHANMKAFGVDNLDDLKKFVGQKWADKAYLSTSVTNFDEMPADDELHPTKIHVKIDLPKGSRGAYVAGISEYPEQDEFLIARNSSFTISDVEIKDGKAFITMKAITPDADTPEIPKTPDIPQQADAPEIETDTPGTYTGPTIEDYAGAPKDVTDRVRAAYLAAGLHDRRVEVRGAELREENPDKYSGWDAWGAAEKDARAELASEAPSGDEFDAALDALTAAIPDYNTRDNIRRRIALEAAVERRFTEFTEKNGLGALTAEVKTDLTKRMKEAFTGKKVAVRVSPKTVEHILSTGRIKSQFETNKSSGKKDVDMRAGVERLLFGINDKPWENADKRPIYGYVAMDGIRPAGIGSAQLGDPSTDALTQYGNVQVVLKDSVRDRTTAMFGDSLNNMQEALPTPINNPNWRSYQASRGGITGKGLQGLDRSGENQDFRAGAYAEAQIHGGIGIEDVEEIVFASSPSAAAKKLLEDSGIPWRVLNFKTAADGSDEERATALRIASEDKPFIEGEIAKLQVKIADPNLVDNSYYKKDLAKYEKQLKLIDEALPLLEGKKTSSAKKVAAAKDKVVKTTAPKQPEAPKIESTPSAKLSVAEEQELTSLQSQISDLYGQSGYWRMLEAEVTHKSGTGKLLTKQDIADTMKADEELKKLRSAATPLVERELELRMKRDGDVFGEVEDPNAERWAKKVAPSSVMLPGNDPTKIDKIADSYRVNDKQTTEHNMALRSGEPTQAAIAWRSRMKRMINSQKIVQDSIVYRGAALTPERIMQLRPGAVMIDPGSMSTDESRGSAAFYMNVRLGDLPGTLPTLFEIRAPKGIPAADVDYGEFVFDFDTPMRIISTKRDENGVVNVVAELVPPAEAKALYGAPAAPKATKASNVNLNAGKRGSISAKDAKRVHDTNFMKHGILPTSSPQEIFDKAKSTAYYNDWSIMQVLEAIDAMKPGYKKTVLDWIKTPAGSAYVGAKTSTS